MNLKSCLRLRISKKKRDASLPIKAMKLTLAIIIICCFNVTASVLAQQITLNVKNAPVESVFKEIKKQSGYTFIYRDSYLENAHNITQNLKGVTLEDALEQCFRSQPFSYEIVGKTVVIKPKIPAPLKKNENDLNQEIQGKVTDTSGVPLPGVTIKVKNTNLSTITNALGNFTIKASENATLVFSFIGFETTEIKADHPGPYRVLLRQSSSKLDEVQVIAYGTTTKRLNTGSVVSIKATDIADQPVTDPLAAMQGRVPGMVITQTSGVPGSSFKVEIRGQSTLDPNLSHNNPLFIIDGVPFESGGGVTNQITSAANNPTSISSGGLSPLNSINPQDIESIDILKDADATAIYGSRGANGVILITTKRGKPGATKLDVNVNVGFSKVGRTLNMLNTQQYIQVRKEAIHNDGYIASSNPADLGYAPDIMVWDTTRYTDFKKLLIGNIAHNTNFQASLSGGNQQTQFRISAGYHHITTVYSGDYSDNIASLGFNINHHSLDRRFTMQFTGQYSNDRNKLPAYDPTRYSNLPPNLRLYNPDGTLSWDEGGVAFDALGSTNPLALNLQSYKSANENLAGNMLLSYSLAKGLQVRVNIGYNAYRVDETGIQPSSSIDYYIRSIQLPSSQFANSLSKSWIVEPQAEYTTDLFNGKLDVLVGNTLQDKSGSSNNIYGYDYNSDLLLNSIGAAGTVEASNDQTQYRYTAVFGRVNYNYHDKYILNITGRRDGSSRFGPGRQWATFGAAGAAWLFTNENWIKDHMKFLSFGKLRGSYGTTGNDQIGDYKFLNLWSNTVNPYGGIPGLFPKSLFNDNYNWEINKKLEVAIELSFLKDALFISGAYYRNRSGNQLVNYTIPTQTGFSSIVRNLPGLVQNSGWELSLNSKNINGPQFKWTTSFNITIPKNVLLAFPGLATSPYKSLYVVGKSLSIIQGYKYLGVDPATGLYSFQDVNGDGQYTSAADYQQFGNRDPKFYGGLQNNLSWKNFDLGFFFYFAKQVGPNYIAKLYSAPPGQIYNQPDLVLSRWQHPGDISEVQKFSSRPSATGGKVGLLSLSDGAYTDASFVKLKNASLSYRLPGSWIQKYHISNCRIFVEGQNLLTITGYKGSDPEVKDFFVLPPLRTIVAGIQLNL